MPTLGAPLDFAKLEAKNLRGHQLGAAPSSPVTGQLYYNTGDNTLYWWDGAQWVSARGGAAAIGDATTSSKGIIQLAGDLAGTATSPQIAAGVITDTDVNSANKDGAVGTPSLRTLGTGAQQALKGSTTLDQILKPNNNLDINTYRIVNLDDPQGSSDAATKWYVDQVAQGLDAKQSVHAATVANIADLNAGAPSTLDGVTLVVGDRVLVKDQTTPAQNGIYSVSILGSGSNGQWSRASDANAWTELIGAYAFVEQGTVNADTGWNCIVDTGGTLGTTAVVWVQFSGAGTILAGAGLLKTGQVIDIIAANPSIVLTADSISTGTLDKIPAPVADLPLNNKKITGLATPTLPTDAATKNYADNAASSSVAAIDAKPSVRVASTANLNLSGSAGTIDGVAVADGDRVLVKDQTTPSQNGIYVYAIPNIWTRALDANAWYNLPGATVWVEEGTVQGDTGWVCTVNQGGTLGTTSITWAQFAAAVVPPKYYSSAVHGAGATISIPQTTHLCRASRGLHVQCQLEADGSVIIPDISVAANGDVTITFAASQSANSIRTTIIG